MSFDTLIPGCIGLSLFGLATAYLGRLIWLGIASRSWPSVEGTITCSRIRRWRGAKGGQSDGTWHHAPVVRYEFMVDGELRTGWIVAFGRNWNSSRRAAQETVNKYPIGAAVCVYHHPHKPGLTTLERRASGRVYQFIVMTSGMMVGIIYGVMAGC